VSTLPRLSLPLACLALAALCMGGCGKPPATEAPALPPAPGATKAPVAAGPSLSSSAFQEGQALPAKYTARGSNSSPPLTWAGACPAGTRVVALVMDDPDAPSGVFTHWLVYDMPASAKELPEAVDPDAQLPNNGGKQGTNDFGKLGYGGPDPPPGRVHHYHFTLYCLDAPTGLEPGQPRTEVRRALKGHILAQSELVGTYGR
jgi:Raf kinase inhibitor-like YbhB/YbcL family protein